MQQTNMKSTDLKITFLHLFYMPQTLNHSTSVFEAYLSKHGLKLTFEQT